MDVSLNMHERVQAFAQASAALHSSSFSQMVHALDLAWVGGDDWSALACLKKLGLINPAATCSGCGESRRSMSLQRDSFRIGGANKSLPRAILWSSQTALG